MRKLFCDLEKRMRMKDLNDVLLYIQLKTSSNPNAQHHHKAVIKFSTADKDKQEPSKKQDKDK